LALDAFLLFLKNYDFDTVCILVLDGTVAEITKKKYKKTFISYTGTSIHILSNTCFNFTIKK